MGSDSCTDLFSSTARGKLVYSVDNVKSLFKMDGCAQICKCFLILFNTLFALVGFGLVALGMWLRFGAETRGFFDIDLNTPEFNIGVIVLVVTGVLMLVMAVIGHCGACNNSRSALGVSSGLLSILIIMQIAAGVMAFVRSAQVSDELVYFYDTIYAQYLNTRSPAQAIILELFHNTFHCCGVSETIEVFVRHTCPGGSFLKQISYSSCPGVIREVFNTKAPLVLGGFLGIAGVMMLVLVCSCVLQRYVSVSHKSPPPYILLGSTLSSVKMI
ncbi:hypothetical protein G5714_004163 [Onychostoma macrolepis]|uniref:Tetraspanin n=1 Tax=Onychostoma macrolepis TaxID=369639 RepID=A0A7J6DCT3_9TELE|nr:hypothetical protein G5714_004163 [Onychostoma macrolepis]